MPSSSTEKGFDSLKKAYLVCFSRQPLPGDEFQFARKEFRHDKDVVLEVCKQFGEGLQFASPELRDDPEVVLEACQQNCLALQYASDRLRNDKTFVLNFCQRFRFGDGLQFASDELWDDAQVVLAACKNDAFALQYASDRLRNDKEFILEVCRVDGYSLRFSSKQLQNDPTVVLEACKQDGAALKYASKTLRNDKELVLRICQLDGYAIKHASEELQDDSEILLEASKRCKVAFEYASERLRDDSTIILEACRQQGAALNFASSRLRASKYIVLVAVTSDPDALKFAGGGLNQDQDCLVAAGLWEKDYYNGAGDLSAKADTRKIVLSTKFSLSPDSHSQATQVAILLKSHPYIQAGNFEIYSPNAFDKSSCDPEWTRFDWPCRGTFETCRMKDPLLKMGVPTTECCWRYSFRYQLQDAAESRGFMIQLVEAATKLRYTYGCSQSLGAGQTIEREMAQNLRTKIFRVHAPIKHPGRKYEYEKTIIREEIEVVISCIQEWYDGDCIDMSECTIRFDNMHAV
jgi:hypothetical protein